MKPKLLISGNRSDFTTLEFDITNKQLRILANYAAPFNASWIEPSSSQGNKNQLIGLSEGDESGLLYTFEINHAEKSCQITSQKPTLGEPAHLIALRDNSAVALATYGGGSVALYPIVITETDRILLIDTPRTELLLDFSYKAVGHGPNKDRQRQSHMHQVLEDTRGRLYAPDLGSDRVWILCRDEMTVKVCGWFQCPPGTGPRHAVITRDETIMYVIGELSHTVVAFDLPTVPAEAIQPIDCFAPSVLPPTVHPSQQSMMGAAEICLHPTIPNVLYVSNRLELHMQRELDLGKHSRELSSGDAIAIILLSANSRTVEEIKHVRSNLDVIRGMRVSDDGKYVAIVGQECGGVEIYGISGGRGDTWTFAAGLSGDLERGVKHAIWL